MINREKALEILQQNMQNQNLRRHCYAVEAVMRALARYFNKGEKSSFAKASEDKWGLVGLVHDADYEKTKENPEKHTLLAIEWLKNAGETDSEIVSAILSHNFEHTGKNEPKNNLEWSLYCCDELTGFIVAVALVMPDKKLSSVSVESVVKKFPQKAFAAGVKREQIKMCEEKLGIPIDEFIKISLEAMKQISGELGL
ncbi:phosphohydrolase [Candidatus Shapirobacteria bacterium CG10_big_fil_rev_8_21_14_0_10_40_9]|uniref:Phosphohydrolase n=1 Tax=Candidatus Shapirobacteria bacterium CG10_big_fil_rev_8_21_14_0_10_40_9 TaxID=1974888 RepID=A0A2M8L4A9_9BACT|nr:MAG: phosphohydrolase [Candidatus Shapirobacteria bacterium CG10_big_fil_rev_8_21_14_0_10_40_9]